MCLQRLLGACVSTFAQSCVKSELQGPDAIMDLSSWVHLHTSFLFLGRSPLGCKMMQSEVWELESLSIFLFGVCLTLGTLFYSVIVVSNDRFYFKE